ncbi:cysteine methyltransferase [Niabella ginsenosidivorans]|uniref:Methylated-DNA--protein-cysteine methyltransferase n=1 Tax=Niabella ginsenosidivorans TaxID=1176587 RepID=A0A1A9I0F7_9BACT|nr:methylated-DNA--[protein]-cysteine S-methyltransferase [Niabella ginsenosidivorans]ANH80210.1 cysteine methyltransferase [Niabella ginsenosidivorans]
MQQYYFKEIPSPVGILRLVANNNFLVAVQWLPVKDFDENTILTEDQQHPLLLKTEQQLNEYFSGKRKVFSIPFQLMGSGFQKKVWELLPDIPYGKTVSYGEIAKRLGAMQMVRAVGGALNKNPVPIIVPCHRVVGADGKMVGFGGGVQNKIYLLNLENPTPQLDLF